MASGSRAKNVFNHVDEWMNEWMNEWIWMNIYFAFYIVCNAGAGEIAQSYYKLPAPR